MEVMVMADPMEVMAMARGRLRPPLMLSLAMDMADPMVDMEDMAMARGRLMLSPAMDTEVMEDLMAVMEVMVMADPMVDMAMESKPSSTKPFSSNQLSCFN